MPAFIVAYGPAADRPRGGLFELLAATSTHAEHVAAESLALFRRFGSAKVAPR
jgi:hypothetical protein